MMRCFAEAFAALADEHAACLLAEIAEAANDDERRRAHEMSMRRRAMAPLSMFCREGRPRVLKVHLSHALSPPRPRSRILSGDIGAEGCFATAGSLIRRM